MRFSAWPVKPDFFSGPSSSVRTHVSYDPIENDDELSGSQDSFRTLLSV